MNKKIKNHFQQEEWIELNLANCAHQVNLYLELLQTLKQEYSDKIDKKEFQRFKRIFKYHKKHLIPAIQELMILEKKHIKLIVKNPDLDFIPMLDEFNFHNLLMSRFTNRFEQLHKEFYRFYSKKR